MPQIIKILSHDYTVSTSGHWLGNTRRKKFSSHGIDPVLLKYSDFSKKCFRSDEFPLPSNMWTWSACVELAPCLALLWCHNGCDAISNHQPHDCLYNHLFRCRSKKTSKFRVTGLCAGNSPVTRKNVSIWWRHHGAPMPNSISTSVSSVQSNLITLAFLYANMIFRGGQRRDSR